MVFDFSQDTQKLIGLGVMVVYVFGSRAIGKEGPLSDFDFGFLMKTKGLKRGDKTYDALYDILQPYCRRDSRENDVIDIVFLRDAPLELRSHVVRYGKLLFDVAQLERGRFEQQTLLQAMDFRPLQKQIDKAILAAL